jgi:hypothetical protein
LTWLDDHSRYALSVTAWHRVSGPVVLATFRAAVAAYGPPASTLTDNGTVLLLVQDLHVRVINAATGELLRELTLDPTRDYQPTGKPRGPKRRSP